MFQIIKRLKNKYGDLYNERNVAISGTHTHSGPGGFHQYLLYDITSLGFVNETFLSLTEGIVAVSILMYLHLNINERHSIQSVRGNKLLISYMIDINILLVTNSRQLIYSSTSVSQTLIY